MLSLCRLDDYRWQDRVVTIRHAFVDSCMAAAVLAAMVTVGSFEQAPNQCRPEHRPITASAMSYPDRTASVGECCQRQIVRMQRRSDEQRSSFF